jgi:hypothetical protein
VAAPEKGVNEKFLSSKPTDDTRAGGGVSPLATVSLQPADNFLPVFPTEFTRIFPQSQSYSHTVDDDLNNLPLALTHTPTPASRNRTNAGILSGVSPRRIGRSVSFQEPNDVPRQPMFPPTSTSPQKRYRNGKNVNTSASPVLGFNGSQSPSLSYILGSDLSDLTDSDLDDPHTQKALVVIKRARKARRTIGNGQKKETALVLYNPKNRALQVKKNRSSPVKGKRRYGTRIARKSNAGMTIAVQKVTPSPRKSDEDIRMVSLKSCRCTECTVLILALDRV